MLGTIILDSFKQAESAEIAKALDDLCSPDDNYGWASTGVYSFFDVDTKETLYLGLAQDFAERFRQHTGLHACDAKCCKKEKIYEYFRRKEKLGFGIFGQSPLSQPTVRRNKKERTGFEDDDLAGLSYAKTAEGQLIEAYRLTHGKFPPWNAIGGAKKGQAKASKEHIAIVKSLSGNTESPIVARSTLRELSSDPAVEIYEETLHAARLLAAFDSDLMGALNILNMHPGTNISLETYIQYLQRTPKL
jgi:hypothetical protein